MKAFVLAIVNLFLSVTLFAQADTAWVVTDSMQSSRHKKVALISGITGLSYAGSLLALDKAWYSQYEKVPFHSFNDAREWLQMDKAGHAWSAYNISTASSAAWRWTGLSDKKAVMLGSISSLGYLTIIELLDARSAKWGWSWADMAANISGTGLYAAQELAWGSQMITFKFSAHRQTYPPDLQARANELFGKSLPERLLKDYNNQTYWLSLNAASLLKNTNLPPWLNLAVGYGAENMFGGFENIGYDKDRNITFYRPDLKRYRQWFLSPDIDFTKIKTDSKALRTIFKVANTIKIPAPALQFSNGSFKAHLIYF